ncbi:hypothetical protein CUMW_143220 [Citrus unshiu]|nr:hypothetical protein CUMW_143220 [Citrus unshiu]
MLMLLLHSVSLCRTRAASGTMARYGAKFERIISSCWSKGVQSRGRGIQGLVLFAFTFPILKSKSLSRTYSDQFYDKISIELARHHTGRHQVAVSSERKIFSTHCCLPWWTKKSHQFDLKASKLQIHFCIRRLNKRRTCKFQQILISDWSAPVLEQNIYEAPCGS